MFAPSEAKNPVHTDWVFCCLRMKARTTLQRMEAETDVYTAQNGYNYNVYFFNESLLFRSFSFRRHSIRSHLHPL